MKMFSITFTIYLSFLLHGLSQALPQDPSSALLARKNGGIDSFIALGESYATGVGAGPADQSVFFSDCLRCSKAYPRLIANDASIPGSAGPGRLINNACSGKTIPQILDKQFDPKEGDKEYQPFGKPRFATISAAGDDLQFKELVLSCIYEFPFKPRKCSEQIDASNKILNDPGFAKDITTLIQTTLDHGLKNFEDFRVYFIGYAEFFNTKKVTEDFCSKTSWSKCRFPQKGCEKLPLTIDLRNKLNLLAFNLNQKIADAVNSFEKSKKDKAGKPLVSYVEIDDIVQGHRYCEEGKAEPVNNDADIWFFQWLDDPVDNTDAAHQFRDKVVDSFFENDGALPIIALLAKNQLEQNGTFAVGAWEWFEHELSVAKKNPDLAQQLGYGNLDTDHTTNGAIFNRVKSFHPTIPFHEKIQKKIMGLVLQDFFPDGGIF